jgi:hypothetical protein
MRQKLRIPIVLEIFKQTNNGAFQKFLGLDNFQTLQVIDKIEMQTPKLKDFWERHPDQRFGQLLSNMFVVDKDTENRIWNIEEDDWLIKNGYCNIEDITFWGVNYYKNGKKRKTTKFVLLKDLKTDHIQNIIKWFEDQNALHKLNKGYLKYFNSRINNE